MNTQKTVELDQRSFDLIVKLFEYAFLGLFYFYALVHPFLFFCVNRFGISVSYSFSYSYINYQTYGFVSRALLGSIFRLFFTDLDPLYLYYFYQFSHIVLLIIYVACIHLAIRKKSDALTRCILYFLACPSLLMFRNILYDISMLGKYDVFVFSIFVLCIYLFRSEVHCTKISIKYFKLNVVIPRNHFADWIPFILIALLSSISILIYHGFVFLFLPVISILFCYRRRYLEFALLNALCLALFIPLQASSIPDNDINAIISNVAPKIYTETLEHINKDEYQELQDLNPWFKEDIMIDIRTPMSEALNSEYKHSITTHKKYIMNVDYFFYMQVVFTCIIILFMWPNWKILLKSVAFYSRYQWYIGYYSFFLLILFTLTLDWSRWIIDIYSATIVPLILLTDVNYKNNAVSIHYLPIMLIFTLLRISHLAF